MTKMLLAKTRMRETMLRKRMTLRAKKMSETKVSLDGPKIGKNNCAHKV